MAGKASLNRTEITQAVKSTAQKLGFELVGITTPDQPPHFNEYLRWLEAGRHGTMEYLATAAARLRRKDPRQILPECRSILVLGVRYHSPAPEAGVEADASEPKGRVAAYAWGDDYHDVLTRRLRDLVAAIEELAGEPVPNRWYTDTGPVLERDLAQRAGLGWIGKNTCLINPSRGSYFLLAEILLGMDLEPDQPFLTDQCGTCTRCLDACPTSCILPDRTLDAQRCISYLTIELKGAIPLELRPQVGEWVFGCDICQQVCPWNIRFASAAQGSVSGNFAPRPGLPAPDLETELLLTSEAFSQKFKGSPVKRAKRRGYLRNIAVALGNARRHSSVPALAQALEHEVEPLVRGHAAWALGQIGGEAARRALSAAERRETDPAVKVEIQAALEQIAIL